MRKSLLVQTLLAFTPEERQGLSKFLGIPPANKKVEMPPTPRLFTLLMQEIKLTGQGNFNRTHLHARFFGKAPDPAQKKYFDNVATDLLNLVRRYVIQLETQRRFGPIFDALAMVRFYRRGALLDRAQQALKPLVGQVTALSPKSAELSLLQFWVDEEGHIEEALNNQRQGDLHLPAALQSLTIAYGERLLEMALGLHQQYRVAPGLERTIWLDWIADFREAIRSHDYFKQASLRLLDDALLLMDNPTDHPGEALEAFLEEFAVAEPASSLNICKNVAAYARNFCVQQANRNDPILARTQMAMYKEHLEKGWLYEEGLLPGGILINMISVGLRHGEVDWVRDEVLLHHTGKIAGPDAESLLDYGYAYLHYTLQEWDAARRRLDKLIAVQTHDPALGKKARILNTKYWVEHEPFSDDLLKHHDAFKKWLDRHRKVLTKDAYDMDINFIRVVNALIEVQSLPLLTKQQKADLDQLLVDLETGKMRIAERLWLARKVRKLLKYPPPPSDLSKPA